MADRTPNLAAVAGWQQTRLWSFLSESSKHEDNGDALLAAIRQVLEPAQTLLVSGQTSPKDFTLHDAGHAFRVAELMSTLLPEDVRQCLTHFEIALLLASAYCHDIGMVPSISQERQILSYLQRPYREELPESELLAIRRWLTDSPFELHHSRRSYNSGADLEYLAQLYIRSRHNDWSEEWMRLHLAHIVFPQYPNWLNDLITLCRSHHEGYERLITSEFEPTLRGNPGRVINLRFLACVLRLADVLEIDPARTPEIVFQHRLVDERSQIYWAKDHSISPHVTSNKIVLHARPVSARLHQAVNETIEQINAELRLCNRIQEDGRLRHSPGIGSLNHRIDLPSIVSADVKPDRNDYEFIDGSFRPNTRKLLELLGGHQLYGQDPCVAVRELMGNALDSVKEAIALHRLQLENPADSKWEEVLGQLHQISLKVEKRVEKGKASWWLICSDTGVGMTKRIIVNHLLVSGSSRKYEVAELESRCREAGFYLERTGQFGIGVLSYFMLADRVVIETRRTTLYGDAEDTGWRFETDGIGTFGELKRIKKESPGTTVSLRLKSHGRRDHFPEDFEDDRNGRDIFLPDFISYVLGILVRAPCKVRIQQADSDAIEFGPGWGGLTETLRQNLERDIQHTGISFELLKPIEGRLYNGELRFRATPYILQSVDGGPRAFRVLGLRGMSVEASAYMTQAWRGTRIESKEDVTRTHHHLPCLIEIDWIGKDNSHVSVSRRDFSVSESNSVLSEIQSHIASELNALRLKYSEISLWEKMAYGFLSWPLKATWPNSKGEFSALQGFISGSWASDVSDTFDSICAGQIRLIYDLDQEFFTADIPRKLIFPARRDQRLRPFVAVNIDAYAGELTGAKIVAAEFPPAWRNVFGAYVDHDPFIGFLNQSCPLVETVRQSWETSSSVRFLAKLQKMFENGKVSSGLFSTQELEIIASFAPLYWFSGNSFFVLSKSEDSASIRLESVDTETRKQFSLSRIDENWVAKRTSRKRKNKTG